MKAEAAYESNVLSELTVDRVEDESESFKEVRVALLDGGALKVFRARNFSSSRPFETVFPHGTWTKYHAEPAR